MARKPTKKQKVFAKEYAKTGNGTQSALKAYDTDSVVTADSMARENLGKPRVMALIEGYAETAQYRIQELSAQEKNLNVALTASRDIMDRAGFKPVEKNAHAIQGDLTISWE